MNAAINKQEFNHEEFPINNDSILKDAIRIANIANAALLDLNHNKKALEAGALLQKRFREYVKTANAILPSNCCVPESEYEVLESRIRYWLKENNLKEDINPKNLQIHLDRVISKISALRPPLQHFSAFIKYYADLAKFPTLNENKLRDALPVMENIKQDVIVILSRYHIDY